MPWNSRIPTRLHELGCPGDVRNRAWPTPSVINTTNGLGVIGPIGKLKHLWRGADVATLGDARQVEIARDVAAHDDGYRGPGP